MVEHASGTIDFNFLRQTDLSIWTIPLLSHPGSRHDNHNFDNFQLGESFYVKARSASFSSENCKKAILKAFYEGEKNSI
jgi:hypothetical protein